MKTIHEDKCTGCGACVDACPKECVKLLVDKDGFFQSNIDLTECVSCGLCKKVCPAINFGDANEIKRAYKSRRIDNKDIKNSTSGGIAALISEQMINKGGAVAGCGYNDELYLKHSVATTLEEVEAFKGSKYYQSDATGIYKAVRGLLAHGKEVLFIGTPCQCSALLNFLGGKPNGLTVVDFVCHGVPSKKPLEKFLKTLNTEEKIVNISYRNKDKGYGQRSNWNVKVCMLDKEIELSREEGFPLWFCSALSVRKSCYSCDFVSRKRCSDITLADYIGDDLTEKEIECGMSMVFVNTAKGEELIRSISAYASLEEKDRDRSISLYQRLNVTNNAPACRKAFFKDLERLDYEALFKKYTLKKILPNAFILKIKAIFRKLKNGN